MEAPSLPSSFNTGSCLVPSSLLTQWKKVIIRGTFLSMTVSQLSFRGGVSLEQDGDGERDLH